MRYRDVRPGQRVIFEWDGIDGTGEGTVGEVMGADADFCVLIDVDGGGNYVLPPERMALVGVWDAIEPYQVSRRPLWAGRASIVYPGGQTSAAELCDHRHTAQAAAWACGRELAAEMNRQDGIAA